MTMRTTTLSCLALLLLILAGCEASLHENFVDIEKPDKTPLGINLNAFAEGENIIIYQENIPIYYSFETSGREVLKAEFTLGDLLFESNGKSGELWFSPNQLPNGNYTLTCNLYVATNTGSIADQAGMEAYGGTMSWKVTVAYEKEPTETPEMATRINEEGYLELTWEKPYYKYMNFLNYTVYKRGELLATIEDAGITSFTDKGHVLDNGDWYNVKANFEDDVSWYVGYKILPNDNITIEQVEDLSAIDFCTVKWSNGKGYKCKWNIYVNQELKMKETEETSISIPLCAFGTQQYDLHYIQVEAVAYDAADRGSYTYSQSSTVGMMGKYLGNGFTNFDYNESDNTLYYSIFDEIYSMSVPDLKPIARHSSVSPANNTNAINTSEMNSRVLVSYNDALALYEGKMLTAPLIHPVSNRVNGMGARILNDDRIFYIEQTYPKDLMACILSADMESEKRVTLPESSFYGNGVVSADGKYIYLDSSVEIAIYTMSPEFEILEKKVYPTNESPFSNARFMPHNSSLLLVRRATTNTDGVITIYNTEDMTAVHSYEAQYANIDPKTGYLCLSQEDQVEIIDINSGETLFPLPIKQYQQAYLLGGILISSYGHVLNINPYLKKK